MPISMKPAEDMCPGRSNFVSDIERLQPQMHVESVVQSAIFVSKSGNACMTLIHEYVVLVRLS